MSQLNPAKPSPRIEDGILKWYVGDTFQMVLHISIVDQDGAPVTIGVGDTITFTFKKDRKTPLFSLTYGNISCRR